MKQTTLEERELVIYHYKNGKSLNKIADIINRKKSTIQYIIKRYRRALRKVAHFICLTKTSTLLILTTKNRMFRFCSRKVVCFHSSPRRIACYALSRRKVARFGTLLRKIARFAFSREKYHVS